MVDQHLFAVRQTPERCEPAAAAALIDLIPAPDTFTVPESLLTMSAAIEPVVEWSIARQQLPFLKSTAEKRDAITALRQQPLLRDAKSAARQAVDRYNELAFAINADEGKLRDAEMVRDQLQERATALSRQFDQEGACSLGSTCVLGVAAVFSLVNPPEDDLVDEKPEIGKSAEELARQYEEKQGRDVKNVSGEHDQYPYDLHSEGPGGVRCIEVKGITNGGVKLSENQRRAATRLGKSYYLYIVRDPLGPQPRLTIIRDPLSKMDYDDVLYSGARYVFNATTWHAAADEETSL